MKKILNNFKKEVILSDTLDFEKFKTYVNLHKRFKNSNQLKDLIKYGQEVKKNEIKNCGENFRILSYNDVSKYPQLKNKKSYKSLKYDKKENVYFDICFATNEIKALYIINKKGKIISLFPYLHIGADPIVPYMLNKKPKKGDMLFQR